MTRIVIAGGGPAGYEAALVAAQFGAQVHVIEPDGAGGGCVLYDCVPSKTFIAAADARTKVRGAGDLGIAVDIDQVGVDLATVHRHVTELAAAQSADIAALLTDRGVQLVRGRAELTGAAGSVHRVRAHPTEAGAPVQDFEADVVLLATGAAPRVVPGCQVDGERILTWRQLYNLTELPQRLVVVGSGVTGAEFASAYTELGVPVTLVSSRDRVLPGEDADAAQVIEDVFTAHGSTLVKGARAKSVVREGDGVLVTTDDGRQVRGSHCLMTVGAIPNTHGIGLPEAGITLTDAGFVAVDRVSRTSVGGIYAAGDCTGVLMLASVAAMQGRIAMWHALGEGVPPLKRKTVSSTVFTHPEIATVGVSQAEVDAGSVPARVLMLPLKTNARAKMAGLNQGFVKLIIRPATGIVIGCVVVAPSASELILPIAVAVQNGLTAKDLAYSFSVYPSMAGSITEAARQLMHCDGDLG